MFELENEIKMRNSWSHGENFNDFFKVDFFEGIEPGRKLKWVLREVNWRHGKYFFRFQIGCLTKSFGKSTPKGSLLYHQILWIFFQAKQNRNRKTSIVINFTSNCLSNNFLFPFFSDFIYLEKAHRKVHT